MCAEMNPATKRVVLGLQAKPAGRGWMACCPAHADHTPSLSINVGHGGRVLFYCHAGCGQEDVAAALRARGILGNAADLDYIPVHKIPDRRNDDWPIVERILKTCAPGEGTHVEDYLKARGLAGSAGCPDLRAHMRLIHTPSRTDWPAMVAIIRDGITRRPIGVHRTYLDRDGLNKAPIEPAKMMLGRSAGGAVMLGAISQSLHHLLVGEGIETVLSVMNATGLPGWAALSTSGLTALNLPSQVREVTIVADADAAGRKAAEKAAQRWIGSGRTVRIAYPPAGHNDFNDALRGAAHG